MNFLNCKSFEIKKPENFDISQIFDCGQCFRFDRVDENTYEGVASDRYVKITQKRDKLVFYNTDEKEFQNFWADFFDLKTDYSEIIKSFADDKTLSEAAKFAGGIRILRQEKWEALCSFIISQNNNIPRIKGIINRMSEKYGKEIFDDGKRKYYSFPDAKTLYKAGESEIFALRTGFRAKYIYDAARTVSQNPRFLCEVSKLDTKSASEKLIKIKGVGNKVAACTLLYGFARHDAFPVDVWVKRILEKYYPDGATAHLCGENAGIAQQYLFYYERCKNNVYINKLPEKNKEK
ncbi:MAG: DNA-3-methyladenine glycosylase 2 family protein [Clostridia bacterium]|nr:DNA-3-methyladenine glycosylase 2 family protein [Clostridia bacterium]